MNHHVKILGRTFEHKEALKLAGVKWDAQERVWSGIVGDYTYAHLMQLVGIQVIRTNAPQERPTPLSLQDEKPEPIISSEPYLYGDDMTYHGYFAGDDPVAFGGFSSLDAFVDYVAALQRPPNEAPYSDRGWRVNDDRTEFTGTVTLDDAIQIARTGWLDGMGLMESLLPPDPLVKRRKRSMTGGCVNVGRLLAGQPNHMTRRIKQEGNERITLFVETCLWIEVKASTALLRVVAVAAMIDRLEQRGFRCRVIATGCFRTYGAEHYYQMAVALKDYGERLNIADLSFALGHPSFLRRLGFACFGTIPQCRTYKRHFSLIDQAFDDDTRPGHNEYYIPQFMGNSDDIWQIIDAITPDDLPIKITRDR